MTTYTKCEEVFVCDHCGRKATIKDQVGEEKPKGWVYISAKVWSDNGEMLEITGDYCCVEEAAERVVMNVKEPGVEKGLMTSERL